ncbi:hypothetical protein BKA64DRAFT_675639 [Cadophora sp. MPI-SDFR-AT-0126]|nr:hypothetical protein BKA64DRAFT_675639 [Leotiomycetes sp. MPI-SDFR-AT-0126]
MPFGTLFMITLMNEASLSMLPDLQCNHFSPPLTAICAGVQATNTLLYAIRQQRHSRLSPCCSPGPPSRWVMTCGLGRLSRSLSKS